MFKSSTALSLSESFTNWHHTSIDTLEGALKSAGLHMDQYKDDTSRIQALYLASQQTGGNLEALQTLSKINIEQIQQTQRLGNLIATQNLAASTYMAEHASRAQATQKAGEINFKAVPLPDKSTYKNPTF